jgi:cardiolipin synthase
MKSAGPGEAPPPESRVGTEEGVTDRLLTIPNVLSLLRLATVPIFVWLFVNGREGAAVLLYAGAASTDFLDGYIARRTGTITELGRLLDPLADRIFILALAIALVARGIMPWWLAGSIIARDLLVLTAFPLLERRGINRLRVSFIGKTATAFLLVGLTLLAWSATRFIGAGGARGAGLMITGAGAALYWVAGGLYAREAFRRLAAGSVSRAPHAH